MNDFNKDSNEEISNELNINHEEKNDPYFEVSCKDALVCFYKLKGFFNENIPEHLSVILM